MLELDLKDDQYFGGLAGELTRRLRGVPQWSETELVGLAKSQTIKEEHPGYVACRAIDEALRETALYMGKLEKGKKKSEATEHRLSELWMKASHMTEPFDSKLSHALLFKGVGWANNNLWAAALNRGLKISLDDVMDARNELGKIVTQMDKPAPPQPPLWPQIVGAIFLALTILFFMYVFIYPPVQQAKTILAILTAFCAGGSFAFFGGTIQASGHVPIFTDSPVKFSAAGGIAVFIVVFALVHYADA